MGLPTPSVGPQIAECQKVLEASGLEYKVSWRPRIRRLSQIECTPCVDAVCYRLVSIDLAERI